MKKPYGTTIFCDDIRDEVDGKKTYVGVYYREMIFDAPFPALVPQFAMAVTLLEPLNVPETPINIKIYVPGDTSDHTAIDFDLPLGRIDNAATANSDPLAEYAASLLAFKVAPLVIPREGHIRVRAHWNNEEIKLGSIRIRTLLAGDPPN